MFEYGVENCTTIIGYIHKQSAATHTNCRICNTNLKQHHPLYNDCTVTFTILKRFHSNIGEHQYKSKFIQNGRQC